VSYIESNDLVSFSKEELLSFYCNAAKTGCKALGHTKGQRNKNKAKEYAAELHNRGTNVPDYYDAAKAGVFNGSGST
tara:strand:+ start:165 stop:395 length:231 start_codon:yes stop_codon:yes gene_type:complete